MQRSVIPRAAKVHSPNDCANCSISQANSKPSIFVSNFLENMALIDIFPRERTSPRGVISNLINELHRSENAHSSCLTLVPHEWELIKNNSSYLSYLTQISLHHPLIIFNTGDISSRITIKNVIEIRTFLHPWEKDFSKIIAPYPVKPRTFFQRDWKATPTVSFMGQVPPITTGSLTSGNIKFILNPIKSSPYLMRKMTIFKANRLSKQIETEVVIRNTFSAIYKNPNLSEHSMAFQEQLNRSDYILCPRGFGNTSMRFYEALSAGRTPILIESNGRLPFASAKPNSKVKILNVNLFSNWEKIILDDWNELGEGNKYPQRQLANKELFEREYSFEPFMRELFRDFLE